MQEHKDIHLSADGVRRRYGGVSDMTIWRWLHDEELKFPAPALVVRRRRFWRIADLEKWEAEQAREVAA